MPIEQKDYQIDGTTYKLQTLPSYKALEVMGVLGYVIAGAARGVGEIRGELGLYDIELRPGEIAAGLAERIQEIGVAKFIRDLVQSSVVKPELSNEIFDNHFAGELDKLWDVVAAILEHNRFDAVLKKTLGELMDVFYSTDGGDRASTRSTSVRSEPGS